MPGLRTEEARALRWDHVDLAWLQGAARLRAGVLLQDNGLVFTTALGTQLDAADVRRSLRTICRKAGIAEEWTPRELRHTFVSLLSDNGMAIEEITRLAGHSSSNVTETVYRHQIGPPDQEAIVRPPRRRRRGSHSVVAVAETVRLGMGMAGSSCG